MEENSTINNNMGLQNLLNEPKRLSAESERLNVELESLVMENYKVFVENLTCSVHLRFEDKTLGDISSDLNKNLKQLSTQCVVFKDRVSNFVNSHKRNRKTLQHHLQLVELLEVPQLVDACARNGFHDEALELANFVNGLERRHLLASEVKSLNGKVRGGSGVIQSIVDEVHKTLASLRQQLLMQLTENMSLPKEIQTLSTLRKLDGLLIDRHLSLARHDNDSIAGLPEKEREQLRAKLAQSSEIRLQMDFLEARTVWMLRSHEKSHSNTSSGSALETDQPLEIAKTSSRSTLGPYGKVIEMLEVRRTSWFSVITQFNALFREDFSSDQVSVSDQVGNNSQQQYSTSTILTAWASGQVSQLLHEMRYLLPLIEDGASLRSVLEQTIYFSSRMSQVGCDFSCFALALFREVVLSRFKSELDKALVDFKAILMTERVTLQAPGDQTVREQLIPLFAIQQDGLDGNPDPNDGQTSTGEASTGSELAAPSLLMRYPPLAFLLNNLLTSCNFLRECPLISLQEDALTALFTLFKHLSQHLVAQCNAVRGIGKKYFGDGHLRDLGSRGKKKSMKRFDSFSRELPVDDTSTTAELEERLDCLYAQAMGQELFPHVLACFESIFNSSMGRVDMKIKHIKAKSHCKLFGSVRYTLSNAWEGCELFGDSIGDRLQACWRILVEGQLLPAGVLVTDNVSSLMTMAMNQQTKRSANNTSSNSGTTGSPKVQLTPESAVEPEKTGVSEEMPTVEVQGDSTKTGKSIDQTSEVVTDLKEDTTGMSAEEENESKIPTPSITKERGKAD